MGSNAPKKREESLTHSFGMPSIPRSRHNLKPPTLGKKIIFPGQNTPIHKGFVNCHINKYGLQANFYETEDAVIACHWTNHREGLESYPGLLHGGISAALIDELMGSAVFLHKGKFGVTLNANMRWHKGFRTGDPITGSAFIERDRGRHLKVKAYLFKSSGDMAVEATGLFFLPTLEQFTTMTGISKLPVELTPYFFKA